MFEPKNDKDRLDKLVSNLNELQITNMLELMDIYITERAIDEFKLRINTEDSNPTFEWKMRGIAEFKDFMQSLLKE